MFVLVVTRRAATGELVRQTLGAQGWWVTAVPDRETAVRSASDQAPQLVVIDGAVEDAAELVRFFAGRSGGPGALLLAAGEGESTPADAADAADAVLPRDPDPDELAASARRLLKQPQQSAPSGLPAPGQVLNAQDIFGDMLDAMDVDSELGAPPEPPPPAVVVPPANTQVETRPMVIPAPSPDPVDEDFSISFLEPALADASPPAAETGEPEEPEEPEEPAESEEREDSALVAPPADPEVPADVPVELEAEAAEHGTGETAEAAIAVAVEPSVPEPVPGGALEPGAAAADPAPSPSPSPSPSVGERLAAMARQVQDAAAAQSADVVGESTPEPDPLPPSEDAATGTVALDTGAADASTGGRASLPGGTRFWLGMAAGLLVFVGASFLLDRLVPAAVPEPTPVTVPVVDAVDLEELVDRELAEREAELRESLLEEERRLQRQLDELDQDRSGGDR